MKYRVFCLEGGNVVERSEYEAEDDTEALALFALRGEKTDCALWCGDRLVANIPKGRTILAAERQGKIVAAEAGPPTNFSDKLG